MISDEDFERCQRWVGLASAFIASPIGEAAFLDEFIARAERSLVVGTSEFHGERLLVVLGHAHALRMARDEIRRLE